jgi:circadian clock protein KaiC
MADERLSSGHARLDEVLGGGLLAHSITVLMGRPGAGKTILAQQYLFANSTVDQPAVFFSTVSEPLDKVLRHGQFLEFFDVASVGRSVFYEDLGAVLHRDGLAGITERIGAVVRQRRPGLLVIDSFKALAVYADDARDYRRFLHELSALLSAFPTSVLWVGEYSHDEVSRLPEFAVADAVISLDRERTGTRDSRSLEVLKLRGSSFLSGRHAFRITGNGLAVFPRLADPAKWGPTPTPRRISSGVPLLDAKLADGYWQGASTLVAGPPGSGKTLLGLHFLFAGVAAGEPGIVATFQEGPAQLERICSGFGWSLRDERLTIMYRSPVDLLVDEWVYEVLDVAERTGAQRALIDSLGDLQVAAGDEVRFREYLYSLLARASRIGMSIVMTQEVADLFDLRRFPEHSVAHMADNVVLLQFLKTDSRLERAVTVLKTRASPNDGSVTPFSIGPDGFAFDDGPPGAPGAPGDR